MADPVGFLQALIGAQKDGEAAVQRLVADAARALGCTVEVRVHRGGKHGWLTMPRDIRRFADWFDRHLRGEKR